MCYLRKEFYLIASEDRISSNWQESQWPKPVVERNCYDTIIQKEVSIEKLLCISQSEVSSMNENLNIAMSVRNQGVWITITGRSSSVSTVQTLKCKQSSCPFNCLSKSFWAHLGMGLTAKYSSSNGSAGIGCLKRNSPTFEGSLVVWDIVSYVLTGGWA